MVPNWLQEKTNLTPPYKLRYREPWISTWTVPVLSTWHPRA